jgi:undecaprenyl-diphosphatase
MEIVWIILLLGLVEGLTEFIPVSSTGHLIVAGQLLGFEGVKAATFEIFIQLGAILAVVVHQRHRFLGLVRPQGQGGFTGARGILLLAITTAPALVAGFLLHGLIKERLFGPGTVSIALLAGGVGILLVERFRPPTRIDEVDDLTWREALLVGLFQCLAMWPGVSRSAATIVGGLLCGVARRTAAMYSFLAAVPIMVAATLYDLIRSWSLLAASDIVPFALGFFVAFASAWAAVEFFLSLLGRFTLRPFAWYRIAVAPLIYWYWVAQ